MPRHRYQEFLKFMKRVEGQVEPELGLHVIFDDCATHKHEAVRRWLKRHPRVHFHFIPTGASWLNLVERFFGEPDQRQLKRLAVTSVAQLTAATAYTPKMPRKPATTTHSPTPKALAAPSPESASTPAAALTAR